MEQERERERNREMERKMKREGWRGRGRKIRKCVVRRVEGTTPSSAAAEGAGDEMQPAARRRTGRGTAGIEREEAMCR
jgi:hypothetical protein